MVAEVKKTKPTRYTAEELYGLLPAVYRQRDAESGNALRALLGVIAEQVGILEEDIENLYENWFIETCDPWVIPYIGDLIGAKLLHPNVTSAISYRSFAANTISYRRRKGTLLVLENLAKDITGWGAKAVEFFQLLGTTQFFNHIRLSNVRTPDIRNIEQLRLLNSPHDTIAHTVEVRNISSGRGFHNIPNIGIFLYRLEAFPVVDTPACKVPDQEGCFTFNALGYDTQLFNNPAAAENNVPQTAKEVDLPTPISRLAMLNHLTDYYFNGGADKSVKILVQGSIINVDDILVADLTDWQHFPPSGKVAIDPVLGRIAFFPDESPGENDVKVSYYYGFSSEIGGGFYERSGLEDTSAKIYRIAKSSKTIDTIPRAVAQWNLDNNPDAVFEIADSEVYTELIDLSLPAGSKLVIRASQHMRPVIMIKNFVKISSGAGASVEFDGLLLDANSPITIGRGDLGTFTLRDCTLVPNSSPSLVTEADNNKPQITIDRTIIGSIDSSKCGAELTITNTIVDGGSGDALDCYKASIERSTVFGKANVTILDLASNSLFTENVFAKRRQVGCVRFCHVPDGSRVPRRYRCQPSYPPGASDSQKAVLALKVKPSFTSRIYGEPGYAQLQKDTPEEIFAGADDGNEMGAFNHLQQTVRLANLKASIEEYTRFGLENGVFKVT